MGKIRKLTEKEYEKYSSLWDGEIRPELIEKWKNELLAGRRIIFLYEENEEILGEAALVLEPPVSEEKTEPRVSVSRMMVREEYRSRGIGGALIEVLFREAEKMGCTQLTARIPVNNEQALRLYRRKGFDSQQFRGKDESGDYVVLLARLDEPREQEEEGVFSYYFASRAMLIAAAVFLLGSMVLGPFRYTELSVAFGAASGILSLAGLGFGFASWDEET